MFDMSRPAPDAAWTLTVYVLLALLMLFFAAAGVLAGGGPANVAVVVNKHSSLSTNIAAYYVAARGIPAQNICRISCSTAEIVSRSEFETNIQSPIRTFLQAPAIHDKIDYIVLTKGVPLGVNYGYATGPLSTTSVLTCVGEPGVTQYLANPYGPAVETAFSHQLNLSGYHLYLVTRLDAYTLQGVYTMIDRSVAPSSGGPIVLDLKALGANPPGSNVMLNQRLTDARDVLMAKGISTIYDNTALFVSKQVGLMGYFSWGSNDPSYTYGAYTSNTFIPGSIADTYVSSSGRTFNPTTGGQSLIADLITKGACGVSGFVSEPYTAYSTYPQVLFDRYTKGYNLAESFYAACPMLFWKSVVVGDPLMAPYATVPQVTAQFPQNPLTGSATLAATAVGPNGIARVDFYLDGSLVGSCTSEPYSIQVDTTGNYVGTHTVNVMAVEASPVATEGWTSASVNIVNPISVLRFISDALPCEDEQEIQCSDKVVTASTSDMGGSEFYIQEANGSSGIRVVSDTPVEEGDLVNIDGALITDSGERSIQPTMVDVHQQLLTPLKPIGVPNRWIGGGNFGANTKGVTGGVGLRNMGLLVKTWGKTTYIGGEGEGFFYIDDGSRLNDGSGHVGLKVKCRDLLKPALGTNVVVTGICSCEKVGDRITRVIKVRRQSDVRG